MYHPSISKHYKKLLWWNPETQLFYCINKKSYCGLLTLIWFLALEKLNIVSTASFAVVFVLLQFYEPLVWTFGRLLFTRNQVDFDRLSSVSLIWLGKINDTGAKHEYQSNPSASVPGSEGFCPYSLTLIILKSLTKYLSVLIVTPLTHLRLRGCKPCVCRQAQGDDT